MKDVRLSIRVNPSHVKMTDDELQAHLRAKKGGHLHKNKKKIIPRKMKYKDRY